LIQGDSIFVNGDGETIRDFCFIDSTVQGNLLAATTVNPAAVNQVFNIAVGDRTSLNDLYKLITKSLAQYCQMSDSKLSYRDFRAGDVRHSQADIIKVQTLLGYTPLMKMDAGVTAAIPWYVSKVAWQ